MINAIAGFIGALGALLLVAIVFGIGSVLGYEKGYKDGVTVHENK